MARPVDEARAARRRAEITLAAAELFARKGYEGTTAADIARAAGISAGSVFYYFADKRAVFRSVFERDLPLSRKLVERCHAESDPLSGLLVMVDELVEPAMDSSASGILVELLRQVGNDPLLMRAITENAAIIQHGLAELIERAIAVGVVDATLDPLPAAAWIQSIIDGVFLNAAPDFDPRPPLRRTVLGFLTPPTKESTR